MPVTLWAVAQVLLRPTAHEGLRTAGSSNLDGFPKEMNENWQEEWFYLPDVPLEDPPPSGRHKHPLYADPAQKVVFLAFEEPITGGLPSDS